MHARTPNTLGEVEVETQWQGWAESRIQKHDKDLYEGNGKPSITVRLDRVERYMEKQQSMLTAILLLLIAAIFTAGIDAYIRH